MEEGRASKRRKLDAPQKKSLHNVGSKDLPTANGHVVQVASTPSSKTFQQGPNGTKSNAAHEAWLEAKAKSKERIGKKLLNESAQSHRVDVYDDIEGAHTSSTRISKAAPSSTPIKHRLDPLRNQKSSAASPSPAKITSTLGFFKQFRQPKSQGQKGNPAAENQDAIAINGNGSPHANGGTSTSSSSSDDDDDDEVATSPIPPISKGNWRGWTYELPKKTFEDEIKDLETAAREGMDKDHEDDTLASSAHKRRERTVPTRYLNSDVAKPIPKASKPTPQKQSSGTVKRNLDRAGHIESLPFKIGRIGDSGLVDASGKPQDKAQPKVEQREQSAPTVTPTKAKPRQPIESAPVLEDVTFSPSNLRLIIQVVLEKLTGRRSMRLTNLNDEYSKIANVISQTITAGESNSMLVIGSRGCGKSAIINNILAEQTAERADDFHVVRLNGFIHTDDRIALREIWRQLGREMELDEDESTSKNVADTLTTLLALLSHPAEQGRDVSDQITKSVIFTLDEFELFASHPRQTLLYNLFDIAQSRKAPIAVLGLTTRIDVAESLEKRVKSRFSHRYIHLSSAKSFAAFHEACAAAVTVVPSDLTVEERKQLDLSHELTAKFQKSASASKIGVLEDWNNLVDSLLSQETVATLLHRMYHTTKSVPDFQAAMLIPMSTLSCDSQASSKALMDHFDGSLSASSLQPLDSKIDILSSLSTLQLAILICAARLTNIHNVDTVPFLQAYEEYKVLASKAKLQASASGAIAQGAGSRVWSKEVAKGAWEDLLEVGLVVEDGSRGGRVDIGLEEIGMSGVELGSWGRWCKEI